MALRTAPERAPARRSRHRRSFWRRRAAVVVVLLLAVVGSLVLTRSSGPHLSPRRERIVELAESQLGVRTDPRTSYCNSYSAFWKSGSEACPNGLRSEEWCADFAAWVWHEAGVHFVYGLAEGDLNGTSASFYEWGVAHHEWHPVGSRYVPEGGDVAVYGLDEGALDAQHVAVVTSFVAGSRGPNVVNGDGSRTAFSVVEAGTDQWKADIHDDGGKLSGYVSPPAGHT